MTTTHGKRTYFLSHSSGDDDTVRRLADALADLDASLTIDSRALRGGDPLESAIFRAIEDASGLLVLVSPRAHASRWARSNAGRVRLATPTPGYDCLCHELAV